MDKVWAIFAILAFSLSVIAEPVKMPSKSEINAAKDAVEALLESGTTAKEFLEMAEETENGAERYHAYRCAFILQAKEGKYAEAAETLKAFQAEVTGVPASEIVSLVDKNVGKKLKDAKELLAVYNDSKAKVTAEKQIVKIKKEIKKNPKDPVLKRSLAEATAISGDWSAALKEFEKAGGEVADIVKAEKKGATSKIAAFWWDYKPHKNFGATNAFKLHAASLYAGLLSKGGLSKFEESLAEKRVAAAEELGTVIEEKPVEGELTKVGAQRALSKQYKDKKLVHCWRFNGDLKDIKSNSMAKTYGNARLTGNQVTLFGEPCANNNVFLGENLIPNDGSAITIEMWAMQTAPSSYARVFSTGIPRGRHIGLSWSQGENIGASEFNIDRENGGVYNNTGLAPLELGIEYHIAVVFEPTDDGCWNVTAYKQDSQTGATLKKSMLKTKTGWTLKGYDFKNFHIGMSYASGDNGAAKASYNEVRIWNRALSEEELTKNAIKFHKAGETMKPGAISAATHSRMTSVQTSSGSTSKAALKPSSSKAQNDSFGTAID